MLLDGESRSVDVYVSDAAPIAGMRLLDGHSVRLDVEPSGRVAIERKTTDEPSSF